MNPFIVRRIRHIVLTGVFAGTLFFLIRAYDYSFENEQWLSGWLLVTLLGILMLYNVRKKLSFIPLGKSAVWLQLHIYTGLIGFFMFFVHIDWKFSGGNFSSVFATIFVLVCVSGMVGIFVQRYLSKMLSQEEEQFIFERIPGFMMDVRRQAEDLVLESVDRTDSSTLADVYSGTLYRHFSAQPRLLLALLNANRRLARHRDVLHAQKRFMSDVERDHSDRLWQLILQRSRLDRQYAIQFALKGWLFIHIPLSYSAMLFLCAHVVIVYAFGAAG